MKWITAPSSWYISQVQNGSLIRSARFRRFFVHVFVTGGSGLTGPAVVTELISAGHTVTGLARSERSSQRLQAVGASTVRGSLDDHDVLSSAAADADGTIHMAFDGERSDPDARARRDVAAIESIGRAMLGSGKPLIATSGTLVMKTGEIATEHDPPDNESIGRFRVPGERACLGLADQGVRAIVVRLSPTVHGPGDYGFVPALIAAARRTGVSAYVGDGTNRWPAVHRLDAARLFRQALESAPAGAALHGVAETGVTLRSIAQHIAEALQVSTASMTVEQAAEHIGNPFLARIAATDAPAASTYTQQLLGWTPQHETLAEDMQTSNYFEPQSSARAESVWLH